MKEILELARVEMIEDKGLEDILNRCLTLTPRASDRHITSPMHTPSLMRNRTARPSDDERQATPMLHVAL